jgi:hypothetical protein
VGGVAIVYLAIAAIMKTVEKQIRTMVKKSKTKNKKFVVGDGAQPSGAEDGSGEEFAAEGMGLGPHCMGCKHPLISKCLDHRKKLINL